MRLDDQQRRVRGPSHETKDDVESQEEPVIGVVVGQASQGKVDQLPTERDLGERGHSGHTERREPGVRGRESTTINVTADGTAKTDSGCSRVFLQGINKKKILNKIKFKILIRKDILSANYR